MHKCARFSREKKLFIFKKKKVLPLTSETRIFHSEAPFFLLPLPLLLLLLLFHLLFPSLVELVATKSCVSLVGFTFQRNGCAIEFSDPKSSQLRQQMTTMRKKIERRRNERKKGKKEKENIQPTSILMSVCLSVSLSYYYQAYSSSS